MACTYVDNVITYIDKKIFTYVMLKIRLKCILICKMNAFVCIVLASVSIVTVKTINRIPVNIPYQGTVKKDYRENLGETENDENERTLNIIDVDSKENTVESNKIINEDMTLTEFILEAAKVLKTFENYDLEETFVILDREVWENMYKGCKSHELTDIRRYVSKQLRLLKDEPADTLRQYLDIIIDTISNGDYGEVGDMVNYLNSLYAGEHEKFIEVLLGLVHRRISADVDLENVLKPAVKSLIFDYYCNLNDVDRHELIKMIKHYWKQINSQIDDYKVGRSINSLPLATPFIHEGRNEQMYKKRRFNTVNEGRALDKSNSKHLEEKEYNVRMRADPKEVTNTIQILYNTTHLYKQHSNVEHKHKVRANSDELTNVTEIHDSKYTDENIKKKAYSEELSWENVKEALSNSDIIITKRSDVVVGGREVLKTVTKDPIKGNAYRTNQMPEPGRSMIDALRLKKPEHRKSNKTIEKLIKIGTLAKEINDIISSDSNSLRTNAGRQDLFSMLSMSVLEFMGDFADTATTTDTVYADGGDGNNKDVSISMKAIVG